MHIAPYGEPLAFEVFEPQKVDIGIVAKSWGNGIGFAGGEVQHGIKAGIKRVGCSCARYAIEDYAAIQAQAYVPAA